MARLNYKTNFSSTPALQLFYTGGPVRIASDASFVACACGDEVKVVDLASGTISKSLEGDSRPITAIAINDDGKTLFAACKSVQVKQLKLWDLATLTLIRSWKAHDEYIVDMDTSAGFLATASVDQTIRVWDTEGCFCTHSFIGHKGVVTRVLFHQDPHRLLLFSGGDDAVVRVWDIDTKSSLAVLEKHLSTVTSLAISKNGERLLTGARDKIVNVWSLRDYSHEATIQVCENVEAVCLIPENWSFPGSSTEKKIAFLIAGDLGKVRVFSSDGVCVYEHEEAEITTGAGAGGFTAAFLLPKAQGVMCVSFDHRFFFYDLVRVDVGESELKVRKRLVSLNYEVKDLRLIASGDGDELQLAVAGNTKHVRIYELSSMSCKQLVGHADDVLCLDTCVTREGKTLLASGGKDNAVRLWDVQSGVCIGMSSGHSDAVRAIVFSKKHQEFFVSGSRDRSIKLWKFTSLLEAGVPENPQEISCSFAAAGAHEKGINCLAVAPDDNFICSASQDCTARVWKLPELTLVRVLKGHSFGVWCVDFSPVERLVLTASADETIRVWDLNDGSCLKVLRGHAASVSRACFHTRGTQIISVGADGLMKLWTTKNNLCLKTFGYKHDSQLLALTVNEKVCMLASGGRSGVNVWRDSTEPEDAEDAESEVANWTAYIRCPGCQGDMLCCWAWTTVQALESFKAISICRPFSHNRDALSVQQLVDGIRWDLACGHRIEFEYFMQNTCICEKRLPYTGVRGTQRFKLMQARVSVTLEILETFTGTPGAIKGFVELSGQAAVLQALQRGPVAAGIAVDISFEYCRGGRLHPSTRMRFFPSRPCHAVLLVGYGVEGGEQYVIIQNSWGQTWGDQGRTKLFFKPGESPYSVFDHCSAITSEPSPLPKPTTPWRDMGPLYCEPFRRCDSLSPEFLQTLDLENPAQLHDAWETWRREFNKNYKPSMEEKRFAVFSENLREIRAHSLIHGSRYDWQLTSRADMTPEEIRFGAYSNPRCFMDISIGGDMEGRVIVELFANQVPNTVDNFVALCTGEKGIGPVTRCPLHYKGMAFHRVIQGFAVQGGDISARDGTGGESIYGLKFDDESFKIKHDREGLLSMANSGPNSNGSQFFITAAPASHLDNKHVVFGKVVKGMGVIRSMERTPTDGKDRPVKELLVAECGHLEDGADDGVTGFWNDGDPYPDWPEDLLDQPEQSGWWVNAADAIKKLGNYCFKNGDHKMALRKYRKALRFLDANLEMETIHNETTSNLKSVIFTNSAVCKLRLNDPRGALIDTENAVSNSEQNHKALYHQGAAYMALNDFDSAVESFTKALEIVPNEYDITKALASAKSKIAETRLHERMAFSKMFQ